MRSPTWFLIPALLLYGAALVACGDREVRVAPPAEAPSEAPSAEPPAEPEPAPPVPEPEPAPEREPERAARTPTPWGRCQVGDWVRMSGTHDRVITMEVTAVGEETVTVRTTVEMPGLPAGSVPAQELEHARFLDADAGSTVGAETTGVGEDVGTETLEIAGRRIECRVTQSVFELGGKTVTSRAWTSDEVPGGLVKTMSDATGSMEVMQEVVDFKVR
jgi:hypothetical protein